VIVTNVSKYDRVGYENTYMVRFDDIPIGKNGVRAKSNGYFLYDVYGNHVLGDFPALTKRKNWTKEDFLNARSKCGARVISVLPAGKAYQVGFEKPVIARLGVTLEGYRMFNLSGRHLYNSIPDLLIG
jgi:hypothetical protein